MPTPAQNNSLIEQHATQFWERFCDAASDDVLHNVSEEQAKTVFGLSEFIAEQSIRHPEWLVSALQCTPHSLTGDYIAHTVQGACEKADSEDALAKVLRDTRNAMMLTIAVLDVTNRQTVEISLQQVSKLAESLINVAYQRLYTLLAVKHGTPMGEHGEQPMFILAMGKLGGNELNFSSDIDLIFAYPHKGETEGGKKPIENQQFFTRLAQKLINSLNKITVDGQVYRVDMRLRPFGESGPLAMHFAALEDYYQEQGRHWERFAMVKARVINDTNSPYFDDLQAILRPFTFRRYLDFTTIDALRDMKQLIATEIRRRRLSGNIKLGAGGIREVEFFAQSFQLIHGGREPELRQKNLLATLDALADLEIVDTQSTSQMKQDYLYLRKVEHTLQQWQDGQTQTLPDDEWAQQILAHVMECESYAAFQEELAEVMERIHQQFNELVEETHESHTDSDERFAVCRDAWNLTLDAEEFVALLAGELDGEDAALLFTMLVNFRDQLPGYRIGQRGEDTLNRLMPELLYILLDCHVNNIRQVLARVLGVINAITGRTTYLDLLLENPDVLRQLIKLCERSEWIASEIQRFPLLLDELLTPMYLKQQNTDIASSQREYQQELRESLLRIEPDDVEMMMDAWRQFKLCQQLRIAASDISGSLPIPNVSDKLTVLAEVILASVVNAAWKQIAVRYGVPGHLDADTKGFAVIGYGKLGGFELGYGSDLDLVFLHNAPRDSVTNGKKSIEAQQFYIKLAQRIMHLLNTTTLFGQLYETDLRLRPSGKSGLLCCHVDGFAVYQREEAWTWEHQALVRARAIVGDSNLLAAFNEVRNEILTRRRDLDQLQQDVVTMRYKMREHLLSGSVDEIDLKQCEGGITDIEFLTQYWVLAHAHSTETLTVYTDNLRLIDSVAAAGLLTAQQAGKLQHAYLELRNQYHQLTLADNKYAQQSEELTALRSEVSAIWHDVLGTSSG
ncbi:bifunctional [glutamate--ammonia ligase]-adenylyl-L-tyrosine phosphorylase/[glutamate--ammonia-ligase] adenylyltransferase [Alteromonas sp. ASW11-19]|uniref:Bifunctional glutamine synthetase adenylyltransferase/adenylyl-removing enzyme n=1 Tax=Alteromonas salexigens TaxID=2982530 RepID=A0ABT2VQL4_9ALTE|nr:bifunctional [glutamate--ammonia ligase]-adenylyl-L-tyrosine phosphorylase/[glutamate--ammonia-ligase] adenylyltransferase [Alteromonas salexigens]MCU7555606.1 bifunctional [glutamate--ammonia ligase]-adenylyl-L-tyrosine phosphorylase/[glutamate--ammonia-ligase] adenylyltransferase [Alteromonas salexigens]